MTDCALYLISPPRLDVEIFIQTLRDVLEAGKNARVEIACLQLRLKDAPDTEILQTAKALKPVLDAYDVALIINDRADLVIKAGADGVHLGQSDGSISEARKLLGEDADIGVTCHASRHLAMIASEESADYVAFGAFYPTATKATSHRPEPEILTAWSQMTIVPCVAIGGITPQNAKPLIDAGADYLAVSSGIWDHPEGAAKAVDEFGEILREQGEPA